MLIKIITSLNQYKAYLIEKYKNGFFNTLTMTGTIYGVQELYIHMVNAV